MGKKPLKIANYPRLAIHCNPKIIPYYIVIKKYNNFIVRKIWKIWEISGLSPAQRNFLNNFFLILIMSSNTPRKNHPLLGSFTLGPPSFYTQWESWVWFDNFKQFLSSGSGNKRAHLPLYQLAYDSVWLWSLLDWWS